MECPEGSIGVSLEPGLSLLLLKPSSQNGKVLLGDLLLRVFSFPFFQDSVWGSAPRGLERAAYSLWKSVPLPHDISGLYCNFPHGCPDTGCCVYENSLDTSLEPLWRRRLRCLGCVLCGPHRFWGRPVSLQAPGRGKGGRWRRGLLSSSSTGTSVYKP